MHVIATIWKKPYYHDRNQRMIEAGVDAFRVKCSHRGKEDIAVCLAEARKQITASGRPVQILADLPEAKIRLGEFPQEKVTLPKGQEYVFRRAAKSDNPEIFIPVNYDGLARLLKAGDRFFIGEGQLVFEVTDVEDENNFKAKTVNTGRLSFFTGVTIPGVIDKLDHVTPAIDDMLSVLYETKPEMVAFSFVSSGGMLAKLKSLLAKYLKPDWRPKVIAKIESRGGVENIDEILDGVDGIMIARGDLALTMPYSELGVTQKYLVKKASAKGKYIIVATQVLQSLMDQHIPYRSEVLDITNAYLDGVSAVMLCPETAHAENPEHSVSVAKQVIESVRNSKLLQNI